MSVGVDLRCACGDSLSGLASETLRAEVRALWAAAHARCADRPAQRGPTVEDDPRKSRPVAPTRIELREILDGQRLHLRVSGSPPEPGDLLWVQEEHVVGFPSGDGCWTVLTPSGRSPRDGRVFYRAGSDLIAPWVPASQMPSWASRLTLEVVSVLPALGTGCIVEFRVLRGAQ